MNGLGASVYLIGRRAARQPGRKRSSIYCSWMDKRARGRGGAAVGRREGAGGDAGGWGAGVVGDKHGGGRTITPVEIRSISTGPRKFLPGRRPNLLQPPGHRGFAASWGRGAFSFVALVRSGRAVGSGAGQGPRIKKRGRAQHGPGRERMVRPGAPSGMGLGGWGRCRGKKKKTGGGGPRHPAPKKAWSSSDDGGSHSSATPRPARDRRDGPRRQVVAVGPGKEGFFGRAGALPASSPKFVKAAGRLIGALGAAGTGEKKKTKE